MGPYIELSSATVLLSVLIVLVSFWAGSNQLRQSQLLFSPYRVQQRGEWYRFLTSGFIHADTIHMVFNMLAFFTFGLNVEAIFQEVVFQNKLWGSVAFAGLFLLGVMLSGLPTYFKHRNNPGYSALGASGGVSSVVFASILFVPDSTVYLYFIPIPGVLLGVGYLIYSHWAAQRGGSRIGHEAHFFGALFGIIYTLAIYPPVVEYFMVGMGRLLTQYGIG